MTNQERMNLAMEAALTAGKMLMEYADFQVDKKAAKDYVTDADKTSETLIRDMLLAACPEDGFLGEESGVSGDGSQGMWVVDPIDGTTNFIRKLHPYTISVAYVQDGQPRAGAVYAPLTGEMFSAYEGGGAYLNGKSIHASNASHAIECILGMSFAHRYPDSAERMFKLIPTLAMQVNDMRRSGSAAYDLCCVACGRYDAFIELHLNIYDIAAGVIIAREAGAVAEGWPGSEDALISGDTVAVTPGLYDWLMGELKKV